MTAIELTKFGENNYGVFAVIVGASNLPLSRAH